MASQAKGLQNFISDLRNAKSKVCYVKCMYLWICNDYHDTSLLHRDLSLSTWKQSPCHHGCIPYFEFSNFCVSSLFTHSPPFHVFVQIAYLQRRKNPVESRGNSQRFDENSPRALVPNQMPMDQTQVYPPINVKNMYGN